MISDRESVVRREAYDVAVIGAGIVGIAQALAAARRGERVIVFDRDAKPSGASIRNFGMFWPIGLYGTEHYADALRSRDIWIDLSKQAGFWIAPCGSLHLAHHPDEVAVLEEFREQARAGGVATSILTPDEVRKIAPGVRQDGTLRGALWSDTEACIDSREAIAALRAYLATIGVTFVAPATIVGIDDGLVADSSGREWRCARTLVCTGPDFRTLLPRAFAVSGLRLCKLQMMRTRPQPGGFRVGPHVAGGLTIRHYPNFQSCPSVSRVRERYARTHPQFDQHGIHLLASQNGLGEVILGDSHHYDEQITPFDDASVDELMLNEAKRLLDLPDFTIGQRWHGVYPKHANHAQLEVAVSDRIRVVLNTNGLGMTLSFGRAMRDISRAAVGHAESISTETLSAVQH